MNERYNFEIGEDESEYRLEIKNKTITVYYYNIMTDEYNIVLQHDYSDIRAGLILTSSYLYDIYLDTQDEDYNTLAEAISRIHID